MSFGEYDDFDALGLAALVRAKKVTPGELLEEAISRVESLNPRLNAVITPMYGIARRATAGELSAGPFSGVPFLLKDLMQAYAGVPLSSGSAALREYVPLVDSEVVARFRGAGLVAFGKTNLPELGLLAVTEPVVFGPTRNPWDLSRTPGGSSGGSAAAVAAGVVPMASANDGGGSIRIPAAWCGLFGLKPSRGRVSSAPYAGEVWEGAVVDHVLTRSVRDSAAALDVTCGTAPGDPYPRARPDRPFLEEVGAPPGRLRIAFTTATPLGTPIDPECAAAVEGTARLLEELGHDVVEESTPVDGMAVARAYLMLYFGHVAADLRWIAEIAGRESLALVEDLTRVVATIGESIPAAEYVESRRSWNLFARAMGAFHERFDLYLTPTTASLPVPIGSLDPSRFERLALRLVNRMRAGGIFRASGIPEKLALDNLAPAPFTQLANLTGQPAMSVPLHWSPSGHPCGSHFMAPVGGEARLLRLAAQLEEARPWWALRPPVHAMGERARGHLAPGMTAR